MINRSFKRILNVVVIILCISQVYAFSTSIQSPSRSVKHDDKSKDVLKLTTVVIDPGHGGHDSGCVAKDGSRLMEKNIALNIGNLLARKIRHNYPEVKVVMTRSTDRFIKLNDRAQIANKNNANLFISIHVNALDPKVSRNWKTVRGFSIHTLGQSSRKGRDLFSFNMDVCKRENAVIKLEDDYTTTYQGFDPNDPESFIFFNLMQNTNLIQSLQFAEDINSELKNGPIPKSRGIYQDPFLVLWKTTMPAVLVEIGFISNKQDLAVMKSHSGQDKIAYRLYKAFAKFKKRYDIDSSETTKKNLTKKSNSGNDINLKSDVNLKSGVYYGTQILVSVKNMKEGDKFFQGEEFVKVPYKNMYKYIAGISKNKAEAKENSKKIKKKFKDSFFVKIEENNVQIVKK